MQVILGTRCSPPPTCPPSSLYVQVLPFGDRILWRHARYAYLHPLQATLFLSLLGGALVDSADLIDALWGHDPCGGPTLDRVALRQVVWRTRLVLAPLGLSIRYQRSRGYTLEASDG